MECELIEDGHPRAPAKAALEQPQGRCPVTIALGSGTPRSQDGPEVHRHVTRVSRDDGIHRPRGQAFDVESASAAAAARVRCRLSSPCDRSGPSGRMRASTSSFCKTPSLAASLAGSSAALSRGATAEIASATERRGTPIPSALSCPDSLDGLVDSSQWHDLDDRLDADVPLTTRASLVSRGCRCSSHGEGSPGIGQQSAARTPPPSAAMPPDRVGPLASGISQMMGSRSPERDMDKISDPVHSSVLMKFAFLGLLLPAAALAQGLDGQIGIHDPSTVVRCNNRFYTYGTGGGSLVSDDGWTWRRGTRAPASRSGAGRHSHWRSVLRVCRRQHRRAAQGRRST